MGLPAFIFFFPYIYTLVFSIVIIINLAKRKKILWSCVAGNLVCVGGFFYLQDLIENHKIVFLGKYIDGTKNWGSGMANAYTTLLNEILLILIFCVVQGFFWIMYKKRIRATSKGEVPYKYP